MSAPGLASALSEDLRPGSNPPDAGPPQVWRHLLPNMSEQGASALGRAETADVTLVPGIPGPPVQGSRLAVPVPRPPSQGLRGKAARVRQLLRARVLPGTGAEHASDLQLLRPAPGPPRSATKHVLVEHADGRLPRYVRDLARTSGLDLDEVAWALAPPRGFRSQKVLFVCEARDGTGYVVKMTQEPRFNVRLAREAAALHAVALLSLDAAGRAPTVAFDGEHAGLLVVGETRVPGQPFRRRARGDERCPSTAAALRWLITLARETAGPGGDGVFSEALGLVLRRYVEAYRPGGDELDALRRAVDRVATADLPAVRTHGDPGAWNLLVDDDGVVGFLDWENSDERGLPLWDTLLFLDSVGRLRADLAGRRFTPARAVAVLGEPLATTALHDHCSQVGIDERLIRPLAITCWMYQAVKEATRLQGSLPLDGHAQAVTRALALR